MELWIRSQDKETLKLAEMLDIYDLSDSEGQCWAIEECGTTIGYYKSKKRALEVLDEIQDIIKEMQVVSATSSILTLANANTKDELIQILERLEKISIYQMPLE